MLYKTLILSVLLYSTKAWTLLRTDAAVLRVFERKALRKIIRSNSELYELLNDRDVVQRINIQRLRWFGYVIRMEEDAPASQVFHAEICGWR